MFLLPGFRFISLCDKTLPQNVQSAVPQADRADLCIRYRSARMGMSGYYEVAKLHCSVEAASTFGGRTSAGHGTQVGPSGASLSGTLTALIPPLVFAGGGSPTTL